MLQNVLIELLLHACLATLSIGQIILLCCQFIIK
uniref:Uncharacterized protein n=1 Tax=Arundo donax TaxID=35708 RepID=A0A0A9BYA1_ARUDO